MRIANYKAASAGFDLRRMLMSVDIDHVLQFQRIFRRVTRLIVVEVDIDVFKAASPGFDFFCPAA